MQHCQIRYHYEGAVYVYAGAVRILSLGPANRPLRKTVKRIEFGMKCLYAYVTYWH